MEMLQDYRKKLIRYWPTSPMNRFNKLLLAINYVRNILRRETAFDDSRKRITISKKGSMTHTQILFSKGGDYLNWLKNRL